MRYPYQKILVKDSSHEIHTAFRPLIPVEILSGDKKLPTYGLIDSGADICLFGSGLCEGLGLKLTAGKKQHLQGVGRTQISFYLHTVTLEVGTHRAKAEVGFSREISHIPFAILGQKGFFENFLVAFNYPKKWVEVIKSGH